MTDYAPTTTILMEEDVLLLDSNPVDQSSFSSSSSSSSLAVAPNLSTSCRICGFHSASLHYGVLSCTGCKTFYRRAIIKRQRYSCVTGRGDCNTLRSARRECRKCRLDKCQAMGMRKTALHPKRDLMLLRLPEMNAGQKSTTGAAAATAASVAHSQPSTSATTFTVEERELLDIIGRLAVLDESIRQRKTRVFQAHEVAAALACELSLGTTAKTATCEMPSSYRLVERWDMVHTVRTDLLFMLEWTRAIPCFATLPKVIRQRLLTRFAVPYLVMEGGYYTAYHTTNANHWLLSNGTVFPRRCADLPPDAMKGATIDRVWRQDALYRDMTELCLDGVAKPFRDLKIMAQEFVTLKLILLFQQADEMCPISDLKYWNERIKTSKNRVIAAMFAHYKQRKVDDYIVRFGDMVLLASSILQAAAAMQESCHMMRVFNYCVFDPLSSQLLFPNWHTISGTTEERGKLAAAAAAITTTQPHQPPQEPHNNQLDESDTKSTKDGKNSTATTTTTTDVVVIGYS